MEPVDGNHTRVQQQKKPIGFYAPYARKIIHSTEISFNASASKSGNGPGGTISNGREGQQIKETVRIKRSKNDRATNIIYSATKDKICDLMKLRGLKPAFYNDAEWTAMIEKY